ncbi:hypothetical protein Tcan_04198 [Toxocara canis]|uniref:Uncharacterized protein n=1 Tax=Toxocara canis TaxID=6265 RepID=A0A0B2VUX5_TOXCA|nr:hypothetical protein Tcan_04198 [Toxocara canis]
MSMFVIVVTNVLFLKPLLFERIFPERYWILYFALLHFLSNLMVFPYLYTMLSNGTVGSMESINVLYFIRSIATVIIVTISAVITIVAIASIVDYHPIGCDSRTMEENRKRLTCFIVYCIPCEILNLPTFALAVCDIVSAVMDQRFYLSSRLLLFDNYVAEAKVATQSSSQMRDVTVIPIVNGHSSSRDRSEVVKTICQNQNV